MLRDGRFRNIWIQPAAGDAGGALGAALAAYHIHEGHERALPNSIDGMQGAYLGPEFDQADIERRLTAVGARFATVARDDMLDTTAKALADGKAVGWFQGRMEFGPRALGNRSILGDPRSPTMQKNLNLKVKYRESFRPFAPSVLREQVAEWFDLDVDSPYMLLVAPVAEQHMRQMTPEEAGAVRDRQAQRCALDHPGGDPRRLFGAGADRASRDQPALSRSHQPLPWLTGCPVLVNTSFNVRSEPIVCTPEDAFRCFMGTELDLLVVGNSVLRKEDQDPTLKIAYKDKFELD